MDVWPEGGTDVVLGAVTGVPRDVAGWIASWLLDALLGLGTGWGSLDTLV
jgi:hypothetical protein